jgi:hypothetical protein
MLGDFAVMNAHGVQRLDVDLAAGRGYAEEYPLVCSVISLEGRYDLAVDSLPMDDCVEVGKGLPNGLIEAARAGLVRGHVWLRRMVDKVVGEKLFENIEVAFTLHLFGVPAHDSLGDLVGRAVAHVLLLFTIE